ncbi:MAG: hypothetical protein ACTHQE_05275 [Thermomicrobiales bacterium]|jgi:hypothetical protein
MDFIWGIVQAGVMAVFIGLAIAALAGLFMIVFGIAAGIGRRSGNP